MTMILSTSGSIGLQAETEDLRNVKRLIFHNV